MRLFNATKANCSSARYSSCANSADKRCQKHGKMKQNYFRLFAIVFATLMFILSVIIATLAGNPKIHCGLFNQTIADVSRKYSSSITPASQTFFIWSIIYLWQVVWLLYGMSLICRSRSNHYLYVFPPILSTTFYIAFAVNNIFTIAWTFVWIHEMLQVALAMLAASVISLYLSLYCSFKNLYKFLNLLYKEDLGTDVWLMRILVQNGLSFYATWSTFATLLNFAIVLSNSGGINKNMAGTISLGIAALLMLLWFMLDCIILDKYVRYTFTPYVVLIVAFTGIMVQHFDLSLHPRNSILTCVLLVLSALMLLCKFFTVTWLHSHQPIIIKAPIYALPTTHDMN
ncbi:uncharacterized protein LOC106877549 isoform X1 [Octopus bimaculoides]|uniref:Uncharacterized protein n=2 Tax=Octopus bimaculoides TaxID=37653 RepID=A0A0L8GDF4_OCTBM|nr:uncharacterized protein LOC106877549 isoform X1 [Octopus bimaculoides]|eukprot:XP_014781962.1 PREDICTED: uncharacterized protein LOC106877549 isoform X1 [Octopus bimaculoides]